MTEWMAGCLLREWTNQTQVRGRERTMSQEAWSGPDDRKPKGVYDSRYASEANPLVVAVDAELERQEDRISDLREVLEDLIADCDERFLDDIPSVQRAKDVLYRRKTDAT